MHSIWPKLYGPLIFSHDVHLPFFPPSTMTSSTVKIPHCDTNNSFRLFPFCFCFFIWNRTGMRNGGSRSTMSTSVPCGCPTCCLARPPVTASAYPFQQQQQQQAQQQQQQQQQHQPGWMKQWSPPAGATPTSVGFPVKTAAHHHISASSSSSSSASSVTAATTHVETGNRRGRKRSPPSSSSSSSSSSLTSLASDAKIQRMYPTSSSSSSSSLPWMQQQPVVVSAAAAAAVEAAFLFQQAARRYPLHHHGQPGHVVSASQAGPWITAASSHHQPLKFHC